MIIIGLKARQENFRRREEALLHWVHSVAELLCTLNFFDFWFCALSSSGLAMCLPENIIPLQYIIPSHYSVKVFHYIIPLHNSLTLFIILLHYYVTLFPYIIPVVNKIPTLFMLHLTLFFLTLFLLHLITISTPISPTTTTTSNV